MRNPIALALLLGCTLGASAGELAPLHARSVDLGDVGGSAYYTVDGGRYEVVATLSSQDGVPVRFTTRLEDGQSVTLSAPLSVGKAARSVDIRRNGDAIDVMPASDATN